LTSAAQRVINGPAAGFHDDAVSSAKAPDASSQKHRKAESGRRKAETKAARTSALRILYSAFDFAFTPGLKI
jgi:hypothetical protein